MGSGGTDGRTHTRPRPALPPSCPPLPPSYTHDCIPTCNASHLQELAALLKQRRRLATQQLRQSHLLMGGGGLELGLWRLGMGVLGLELGLRVYRDQALVRECGCGCGRGRGRGRGRR